MAVTRVEAVTKTKYKVYVDGQFAFILYKGELSRFAYSRRSGIDRRRAIEKIRNRGCIKTSKASGNASSE